MRMGRLSGRPFPIRVGQRMRLFVDCEFNGFGGQLMSMAVVSEDGREFYQELALPEEIEPWVAVNVAPLMTAEKLDEVDFRCELHRFLRQFKGQNPVIIADWYTDLVHFFDSMRGRDHSECYPFACKAELILIDKYDSKVPHHALHDARAIRDVVLKEK